MELPPYVTRKNALYAGAGLAGAAALATSLALWGNKQITILSIDSRPSVDSCINGYRPSTFIENQGVAIRNIAKAETNLIAMASTGSLKEKVAARFAISTLRTDKYSANPSFSNSPAELFCKVSIDGHVRVVLSPGGEATIGQIEGAGVEVNAG